MVATVLAAVCAAAWIAYSIWSSGGQLLRDTDAYWNAAQRIVQGQALYGANEGADAFRYAPWFAVAWVPALPLPKTVAYSVWGVALGVAWAVSLWPLRKSPGAVFIVGALTFQGVWYGNVQSLMIAPLVYRFERPDGPIWVGIAASLKVAPILLALSYLGRRQWRRAFFATLVTAVLAAPILVIGGYPARSDAMMSFFGVAPLLWAVVAVSACAAALLLARSKFSGFSAGLAAMAALPRFLFYDAGLLLVGLAASDRTSHAGLRQPAQKGPTRWPPVGWP